MVVFHSSARFWHHSFLCSQDADMQEAVEPADHSVSGDDQVLVFK